MTTEINMKMVTDAVYEYYQLLLGYEIPENLRNELMKQFHERLLDNCLGDNNQIDYDKLATAFRDAILKVQK
jgi:hypothetical protein